MTKIQWTEQTWNPVTGCAPVSKGCTNCYAHAMSKRLAGMGQEKYQGVCGEKHFNGKVRCHWPVLADPQKWRKSRRVFVCSMSDLYHRRVPEKFIVATYVAMSMAMRHTYQILTKRPDRMLDVALRAPWHLAGLAQNAKGSRLARSRLGKEDVYIPPGESLDLHRVSIGHRCVHKILPNVWLGASCEDQDALDKRGPQLLSCPAAVRFLSLEPLLGPIDTSRYLGFSHEDEFDGELVVKVENPDQSAPEAAALGMHDPWVRGVDWVIVGGESGPGARLMQLDWLEDIQAACKAAKVPLFVKQYGSALAKQLKLKHPKGGNPDEWPHKHPREYPTPMAPRGES